jgi:hypothetical protein
LSVAGAGAVLCLRAYPAPGWIGARGRLSRGIALKDQLALVKRASEGSPRVPPKRAPT